MTQLPQKIIVDAILSEINTGGAAAESLRGALDIISSDIYANEDRFIYELLQNACDSGRSDALTLEVEINLRENGTLILTHNGKPFDKEDVKALCSINKSTKSHNGEQIGYKGIGFKSIFAHAHSVLVQSGGFSFKFEKSHWQDQHCPWQLLPIWVDMEQQNNLTRLVIELRTHEGVEKHLQIMANKPSLVLFLEKLKQITITTPNCATKTISRRVYEQNISLLMNDQPSGTYLSRRYTRAIPEDIGKQLSQSQDIPDKMRCMTAVPITFALPLSPDNTPRHVTNPLHAFFPTEHDIGLPAITNSCFLTTASRERIKEHPWNYFILREMVQCLVLWLSELALSTQWRKHMLSILPVGQTTGDTISGIFHKELESVLPHYPCIPDVSGVSCISTREAFYDKTAIFKLFGKTSYVDARGRVRQRIHDEVTLVEERLALPSYELAIISMREFGQIVAQLAQDISEASQNLVLAKDLYKTKTTAEVLKTTKWILDTTGKLCTPAELFWPPDNLPECPADTANLHFMASPLAVAASQDDDFKAWLSSLGVSSVDAITLIRKLLFPRLESGTIDETEHDGWLTKAHDAHRHNELKAEDYARIGMLSVHTKSGERHPAKDSWIGKPYITATGEWEDFIGHLPEFKFISDKYSRKPADLESWKEFFNRCGAASDLEFIDRGRIARIKLDLEYLRWIDGMKIVAAIYMGYTHQHSISKSYAINIDYSLFQEPNLGHKVAKRFFQALSRKGPNSLLEVDYHTYGQDYKVPSPLVYDLKTKPVWPATDGLCHCATSVVSNLNPILSDLADGEMYVLDFNDCAISNDILKKCGIQDRPNARQCINMIKKMAEKAYSPTAKAKLCAKYLYQQLANFLDLARTDPVSDGLNVENILLLSVAGNYRTANELYYAENRENLAIFDNEEIVFSGDLSDSAAASLFEMLGVNIVREANITVLANDPSTISDLHARIIERTPLLCALYCGGGSTSESIANESTRLGSLLKNLAVLGVNEFSLCDSSTGRKRTFSASCYLDNHTNTVYLTRPWHTASSIQALSTALSGFIGIPTLAHDIHVVLELSTSEGRTWLTSKGYELPQMHPESRIASPSTALASDRKEEKTADDTLPVIPDPTTFSPPPLRCCTGNDFDLTRSDCSFGEYLLDLLGQQASAHKEYIYHFTHVENVPSILAMGKIAPRASEITFSDSAGQGLIARTTQDVKQFARFYFRPLTPTQWHNECLGRSQNGIRAYCPVPVFFRILLRDVLITAGARCAVSNGNMASAQSHYGNSIAFLKYFDATNIYALFGHAPLDTYMAASQQEFLVYRGLELANLSYQLVCRDEQDRTTLVSVLNENHFNVANIDIIEDPSCFHPDSPRLAVIHASPRQLDLKLTGARSAVEGCFAITINSGNHEAGANGDTQLIFDNSVSVCGALPSRLRVLYRENGNERLVYACTP